MNIKKKLANSFLFLLLFHFLLSSSPVKADMIISTEKEIPSIVSTKLKTQIWNETCKKRVSDKIKKRSLKEFSKLKQDIIEKKKIHHAFLVELYNLSFESELNSNQIFKELSESGIWISKFAI